MVTAVTVAVERQENTWQKGWAAEIERQRNGRVREMRGGRKARLSEDRRLWPTRKEKHGLGDLEECQAAAVFGTKDHRKPMLRALTLAANKG